VRACQNRSLPRRQTQVRDTRNSDEVAQTKVLDTCQVEVSKNRPQSTTAEAKATPSADRDGDDPGKTRQAEAPWRPMVCSGREVNAI